MKYQAESDTCLVGELRRLAEHHSVGHGMGLMYEMMARVLDRIAALEKTLRSVRSTKGDRIETLEAALLRVARAAVEVIRADAIYGLVLEVQMQDALEALDATLDALPDATGDDDD